ncbi:MAG: 30S ribosomal protein THX [Chitinispirillaceae bacterium]
MGRGDRRTRKGKIFRKSHGKTRPRKNKSEQKS